MVKLDGNKISMTRGDTVQFKVNLTNQYDEPYIPVSTDHIYFRVKQIPEKKGVTFEKEVNLEDMTITLEEEDTAELKEGTYYYEIELVSSNNFHFTAITKTPLKLTTEIEDH